MPKDQFLGMKPYGGYTMLIFAVTCGHLNIVIYLVEELGANLNETSKVK